MSTVAERRDAQRESIQVAPPIEATYAAEMGRNLSPHIRNAVSVAVINKSNLAVSDLLKNSLKIMLRLSKTLFGSVSQVFKTFNGLKNMIRGK